MMMMPFSLSFWVCFYLSSGSEANRLYSSFLFVLPEMLSKERRKERRSQRAWNCSTLRAHWKKLHSEFAPSLKVTAGHPEAWSSCVDQAVRASAEKKMCFNGGSRCEHTTPTSDTLAQRRPNQHCWTQRTHKCTCMQGYMLPAQTAGCKNNLHAHTHTHSGSVCPIRLREAASGRLGCLRDLLSAARWR